MMLHCSTVVLLFFYHIVLVLSQAYLVAYKDSGINTTYNIDSQGLLFSPATSTITIGSTFCEPGYSEEISANWIQTPVYKVYDTKYITQPDNRRYQVIENSKTLVYSSSAWVQTGCQVLINIPTVLPTTPLYTSCLVIFNTTVRIALQRYNIYCLNPFFTTTKNPPTTTRIVTTKTPDFEWEIILYIFIPLGVVVLLCIAYVLIVLFTNTKLFWK